MKKIKYFLIACFVFFGCFFSNYTFAQTNVKKGYVVEFNLNEEKEAYIDCVCSAYIDYNSGELTQFEFNFELATCIYDFPEYSNLEVPVRQCYFGNRDSTFHSAIRNFK